MERRCGSAISRGWRRARRSGWARSAKRSIGKTEKWSMTMTWWKVSFETGAAYRPQWRQRRLGHSARCQRYDACGAPDGHACNGGDADHSDVRVNSARPDWQVLFRLLWTQQSNYGWRHQRILA